MTTETLKPVFIRRLITAAHVAVLFGLLLFLLSFCSCSAKHRTMTESSVSEFENSVKLRDDSVSSRMESQTSSSGYLDISDLTVIFYPQDLPCDSVLRKTSNANRARAQPAVVNIGHLSAGISDNAILSQSKDSVNTMSEKQKQDKTSIGKENRIRDPTTPWPVIVMLVSILLVISFTAYHLYRSFSLRKS